MLYVVVDKITPRIQYVFDFILKERGVDYTLQQRQEGKIPGKCNLVYGVQALENDVPFVQSAGLLFAEDITLQSLTIEEYGKEQCLSFDGVTDPVASIFYLLTRYEEYVCEERDMHGRFPFHKSVLSKGMVEKAMCDRWAVLILELLGIQHNVQSTSKIIPTFDIDNTYAYRLKSGKRRVLSVLRDRLKGDKQRIRERKKVKEGIPDPYDTFSKIKEIYHAHPDTKLFWLVGERSKYDRNISVQNAEHQQLIRELSKEGIDIGLHPSYASLGRKDKIAAEKNSLQNVLGKPVTFSRNHFLRFRLPQTFQQLEAIGFREEYSMGFAEQAGFRSGTARKHVWFDLSGNTTTNLMIRPFVYMDGTLNEYMKLSVDESKHVIDGLFREVSLYGGDFIFVWHNETIGNYGIWKGWDEVLKHSLDLAHAKK